MSSIPQATYIYALIDPRDQQIRYVGKATDLSLRLRNHIKDARKGKSDHKSRWIAVLLRADLRPALEILEQCPLSDWRARECYWIEHLRAQGCRLTNAKEGGAGYDPTPETRAKMSVAAKKRGAPNKGKRTSDEVRAKQSEAAKRRWARTTEEERREYARMRANRPRKPISEETRERMREGARKRVYTPEQNARNAIRRQSLTAEQVLTVRQMLAQGIRPTDIARSVGTTNSTIWRIRTGRGYKQYDTNTKTDPGNPPTKKY
jgi:group I intron endonuclease